MVKPHNTSSAQSQVAQLDELLVEQEASWQAKCILTIEQLVERLHPAIDREDVLLALICNEIVLRERSAETPTLAEYQQRFPALAEALRIQWEIDRFLDAGAMDASFLEPVDLDQSDDQILDRSFDIDNTLNRESPDFRVKPHNSDTIAQVAKDGVLSRRSIGRYEIRSELGRGSTGIVYLAWDPKLKRLLALKRLRSGVDASDEELHRIRAEAEAIAQVRHPNIVQIYDVGEYKGLPFFVMEYCEGGSLASRLSGIPLPASQAAELVKSIGQGLALAHSRRVIHRDLKPGNVLLEQSTDWSPKITDFGLAKLLDWDVTATATGTILGSPAYMAPEQAFGDSKHVGPAADIYSLGAILYECLTGRPPFRGVNIADTLDQVKHRDPVAVRQLEPKVPLDLETITHKCLRKDPNQRYLSANELVDDLTRHLENKPILARRESWFESSVRVAKKHPLAVSLASLSVLLLMCLTVGSTIFAGYLQDALKKTKLANRDARLGQAEALVGRAHGTRLSRQPGQRFDALASIQKAAAIGRELEQPLDWYETLRDEAIAALQLPDICTQDYREEGRTLVSSDFSNDHRLCALSFHGGDTSLRRLADQYEIAKIPGIDEINGLAFVGNHRLLQFGFKSGIFELWNVDTPNAKRIWRRESDCKRFYLSENQNYLAVANATTLQWIDLENGTTRFSNPISPFLREPQISIHPVLPIYMIFGYFNSRVELRDLATGKTLWEFECDVVEDERFSGAAWSPDGTRLALLHGHGAKFYWFQFEAATQSLSLESDQESFQNTVGGGTRIRFDHSGGYVVGYDWGLGLMLLDSFRMRKIASGTGRTLLDRLAQRIDPRGQLLGFAPSLDHPTQVGTMKIASGDEFPCLFWNEQDEYSNGYSRLDPTGSFVIIPGRNGFVIIDVASRQEILRTKIENLNCANVCFDRNGHFSLSSDQGVIKWPYQLLESPRRKIALGIPSRIPLPPIATYIASSDQGDTVAASYWDGLGAAEYAGCWMLTTDEVAGRKMVGGSRGGCIAVSNNGRACILNSTNKSVLLKRTGHDWDETPLSNASPSPCQFGYEDRIVLTGNTLWSFPEWTQLASAYSRGNAVCMSEDSKQIASVTQSGLVCLAKEESGKPFVRFQGSPIQFSIDAESFLFVSGKDLNIARLPIIRQGLIELGIPWNGPDYRSTTKTLPIQRIEFPDWMANLSNAEQLMDLIDKRSMEKANLNPNNPHDVFASGLVLLNRRQLELASEHLERVCQLMPNSVTAPQWRAYVLAAMAKFDEAIQVADGVLNRTEDVDFRRMRAEWLYHAGQLERARDECTGLLNCEKPTPSNAYALRSLCLEKLGQVDEALEDMRQFRLLAPGDVKTLELNARIWTGPDLSLRQPILAQLYVDKLLNEHSRFLPEVRETIAITLVRNGRYDEAMEHCQEILKNPSLLSYGFGLACKSLCNTKLGELAEAQAILDTLSRWERPELKDLRRSMRLKSLIQEVTIALREKQP